MNIIPKVVAKRKSGNQEVDETIARISRIACKFDEIIDGLENYECYYMSKYDPSLTEQERESLKDNIAEIQTKKAVILEAIKIIDEFNDDDLLHDLPD